MPGTAERTRRLIAACILLHAGAVSAQGTPAPDAADPPPIVLQPIPHFATEQAARDHCAGDAVVWADSVTGFFYPKVLPAYGHGPHGTFTCLKSARAANYWDANPFSDSPFKGREFPIDPSLFGPGV